MNMSACSGGDRVSLVGGHASLPSGRVAHVQWKCWATPTDQVFWKMLTPLEQQFEEVRVKSVFDLTSYLSRQRLLFTTLLEQFGSAYDEHVLPSRLALQRRDIDNPGALPVKAEYVCSTKALLVIFVWYSMGLRSSAQKDRAKALLRAMLLDILDDDVDWWQLAEDAIQELRTFCAAPPARRRFLQAPRQRQR